MTFASNDGTPACKENVYIYVIGAQMVFPLKVYLKVPESLGKGCFRRQRPIDDKFEFAGAGGEAIANINTYAPGHFADQSADFGLEIRGVVHDIHVGMSNPGLGIMLA